MLIEEQVVLVDENDTVVGTAEKMQAHRQALRHRAFSVFVVREMGGELQTLIQQRQHDKYHCGGLWTNTCCSHPRPGEEVIAAGERRLKEEMNLELKLYRLGAFEYKANFENGLTEFEYDHVLVGVSSQENIAVNPSEVSDYRWVNIREVVTELNQTPHLFTPWFPLALEILQKKLSIVKKLLLQ